MSSNVTVLNNPIKEITYNIENDEELIKYEIANPITNINITLKENTKCSMIIFENEDLKASVNVNVELKENSNFKLYNVITTSNNVEINIMCYMNEINSSFESLNVVLASDESNYHSYIDVKHNAKNTNSNVEVYAIAKDNAKITLDNNATIKKGCSKTIAHQKAKGLTLNKKSVIKALPNLFIDEYDVIANHAASIGSLNPEDLFYLMSRGLTKEEASKIIIMGFITPLIECVNDEEIKKMILNNFMEKSNLK